MTKFRGNYTVMVTPFSDDGSSVDEGRLRKFVDWQIKEGVHGLIPLGSTGEFLSQTDEERTRVAEIVISEAAGRVPVLVGTAAEWTNECVRYTKEAEQLGADGVMIVPPYYSSPTEDELFEHYRRVGEAVSIPIMIYNNPFTSNVDLKPHVVARLSEIDNVSYIKESSGDVARVCEIQRLCGERMTVFAGYLPFESYAVGAEGYVAVCSNIAPKMAADLFTMVADDGNIEGARKLYFKLLPLIHALAGDLYVSATKAALKLAGVPVGPPRPPRLPLPAEKNENLKEVLAELGLLA
ncbi:MAG: 4-hydroxy-tetrahydrodipicolinate synthase [Rhodospirillales bacterium]|nr:4-hydroxy-tetrahydrodipicolinate synthase [Rhodospirillales bacterium]